MRERPHDLLEQTSSLDESGIGLDVEKLKSLLAESFRERMGITLQEDRLTTREQAKSAELVQKYRDDGWNLQGTYQ